MTHIARAGAKPVGAQDMPMNRLAYAALVYAGDSEAAARAGAEKLLWYMTGQQSAAAPLLSAGLHADGGARENHARCRHRSARRQPGAMPLSTRRSRPA